MRVPLRGAVRLGTWAVALTAAGALVFLALGEREVPRPPPARGLILVLGPTPTSVTSMPALARLRRAGRSFDGAFAVDPDAMRSREATLSGQRPTHGGTGRPSLARAFAAGGFAVASFGRGLPASSPKELSSSARFLAEYAEGRFLAIVGLTPSRPEEGWRPTPEGTAAELPSIAVGDLPVDGRPGGRHQPVGWSRASRHRAEAQHMEACRTADSELGLLLEARERHARDALVVYLGDPVPDLGAHGLLTRRDALFDDTLQSVVVVQGPGLPPRERSFDGIASGLGVASLLADLAGFQEPAGSEPSLLPRLLGHRATRDHAVLSSTPRNAPEVGRSLRSRDHRYTEWPDGSLELFDHRTDPGERTNLAHAPDHAPLLRDLRSRLERAETGVEPASPVRPTRARRVILLIVDDLNAEIGAWGAPVRTPAIDSLASRGVRFSRAYATVSACSPSRSAFLLGMRPATTGIWNNEAVVRPAGLDLAPVQEVFSRHGFMTASVGKVYHDPEQFLWDIRDGPTPEEREEHPGEGESGLGKRMSLAEPVDADDLSLPDGRRAQRAAQILDDHHEERLFLAVGIVRPHRRWIAPRADFDLYPPDQIALPEEPPNATTVMPAIAIKTKAQLLPGVALFGREPPGMVADPAFRREAKAAYRACVTFADRQVGRILQTLDRLDLWRDSIVVLVGDNGYHLGDHGGLYRKDTLYEASLQVPLIIASPDLEAGRVVDEPVELLGLYRTLLDLGGIASEQATPGRSLTALLSGAPTQERPGALSYRRVRAPGQGWSIRTEHLRYTLWPDGSEELYDIRRDPGMTRNRADSPEHWSSKASLRARIASAVEGVIPPR